MVKRSRVAFVESYPHVIAGQQRTIISLMKRAPEFDMEPVVMAPGEGVFVDAVKDLGFEVVVQKYPEKLARYGQAIYHDGLRNRWATLRDWWKYVRACRNRLKELRPDAVFCNDMRGLLTAGLAARLQRCPVMIWDKLDQPHGILDWFQLPLANRNIIIANSVAAKYPGWQRWWYRSKIEQVSDGADLNVFAVGQGIRSEFNIPETSIVIGIIGTVTHRKGHDRLMRLVPELVDAIPKVQLLVVGSWEDTREDQHYYQSLVNRLHPRVHFVGRKERIRDIMNSVDILVIPSRHEGMPLVIAEAMACGKPVVGARAGGIPEIVVHGETGLIFEGDDKEDFLGCLVRLAKSADERSRMGEAGRKRAVESFDRSLQMKKVCRYLAALAERIGTPECQTE